MYCELIITKDKISKCIEKSEMIFGFPQDSNLQTLLYLSGGFVVHGKRHGSFQLCRK